MNRPRPDGSEETMAASPGSGLMFICAAYRCYLCGNYEVRPRGVTWVPSGWRTVRRGYAGIITICIKCNDAGHNYQKDTCDGYSQRDIKES